MIDRNKRGIRSVGVKARLAVAAAVLVGGGAAGVVAVAANHGGSEATVTAESAGFTRNFHHTISEPIALTEALNDGGMSAKASMTALADMTPMRNFSQIRAPAHHVRDPARHCAPCDQGNSLSSGPPTTPFTCGG